MVLEDPTEATLFRALHALGRACATGRADVVAPGGRRARLELVEGRFASVEGTALGSETLGDVLEAEGVDRRLLLDATQGSGEPIGESLTREGRVSRGALEAGLRAQIRARLPKLLGWERAKATFRAETIGKRGVLDVADALVDALRRMEPRSDLLEGDGSLVAAKSGTDLLTRAALRPDEIAAVALLERGDRDGVRRLIHARPALAGFLGGLRTLGLVVPRPSGGSYAELVVAREALRRGEGRSLDRERLREHVRRLHPDRFHGVGDEGARAASGEVLRRLLDLSTRGSRSTQGRR